MSLAVDLYAYTLPLTAPLALRGVTLAQREGLLLRLRDKEGRNGWGEAAPLLGFSRETLGEAREALLDLRPSLAALHTADRADLEHDLNPLLAEAPSAVRFAVEQAALSLWVERADTTLAHALGAAPASHIAMNGLLMGDTDTVLRAARQQAQDGFSATKLKVGRPSVDDDIALVRAVRDVLGPGVALRLDANQAWTMDEARRFAEGIAACAIDYIEEPLVDPAGLPDLFAATGLPVALDESLVGLTPEHLRKHAYARAIVLKPMLNGGLLHSRRMARDAVRLGMTPVVSASFEAGVGMQALVALTAGMGAEAAPAGLDTYRYLAADVLTPRLPIGSPELDVKAILAREVGVDLAQCTPVATSPTVPL